MKKSFKGTARSASLRWNWKLAIFIATLIGLLLVFWGVVVKDISQPLSGGSDTDYWEYTGFYLAKNIRFIPFPQLDLITDQSFYPYGVNAVFQPWGIERDFFYAICHSLFGLGGWIQIYYLISIAITFSGTVFLLLRDYGFSRSLGAGLLVTAGSFYTIGKYPSQSGYAFLHWTVLSFIVDFLLVKRCVLQQRIPFRLVLLRLLLLILSLGQELGYVAGFALTSFTVSTFFILGLSIYRRQKNKISTNVVLLNLQSWKQDFWQSPFIYIFLIATIAVVSYLNLSLVLQISQAAKSFDFSEVPSGFWWVHPLRLLIPFFPVINPTHPFFNRIFQDIPDTALPGSPGIFFLVLGGLGLWQARKQIAMFIPLLSIFMACVFYPAVLGIFPWFAFFRVTGRVTMIYPVILTIFALHFRLSVKKTKFKQLSAILIALIACLEFSTFYYLRIKNYQPYVFAPTFWEYMATVKTSPGEAVLDFPFCAIGGNAVGAAEGLCPYYTRTMSNFSLRRFHEKKVVGQYFGRLHPDQIKSLVEAELSKMFSPDSENIMQASSQTRCFDNQEWMFFEKFYHSNDFAGINLYTDLLPPACVEDFYQNLGYPITETLVPLAGKVVFIPKQPKIQSQVDRQNKTRGTSS